MGVVAIFGLLAPSLIVLRGQDLVAELETIDQKDLATQNFACKAERCLLRSATEKPLSWQILR